MDINSLIQTILSKESIENVSTKTGAPVSEVKSVLGSALPMLLNGANNQANNVETSASFTNALNQHSQNDTASISTFFNAVDMVDGAKIVSHLLGSSQASQTQSLVNQTGVSEGNANSILSAVAPLLMSLIGQQANNENSSLGISGLMSNLIGGSDLNSIMSGFLTASNQEVPIESPQTQTNIQQQNSGLIGKILGLFK